MKKLLLFLAIVFFINANAQVLELNPATPTLINPNNFIEFNGKMYFVARNTSYQYSIYATDGSAIGIELIKNISVAFGSPIPVNSEMERYKIVFNNKLYFSIGTSLYQSDGTAAGTVLFMTNISSSSFFKVFNNRMYFIAFNSTSGTEIWSTDGTTAGTTILKDINPGYNPAMSSAYDPHFTIFKNKMFFVANDGITGYELWSTDGTESGTAIFKDIRTVEDPNGIAGGTGFGAFFNNSLYSHVPFKIFNNKMYFCVNKKTNAAVEDFFVQDNFILWETDGTQAGTQYVRVPVPNPCLDCGNPTYNYLYAIKGMTVDNNQMFVFGAKAFHEFGGIQNGGVYKIDKTNPIVRLKGFGGNLGDSGTSSSDTELMSMKLFNGEYYFLGSDDFNSPNLVSLWKMNPITYDFTKISGPTTSTGLNEFASTKYLISEVFNNKLYFLKSNSGSVFSTDGTVSGTVLTARSSQINNNNKETSTASVQNLITMPDQLKVFNNALYFQANFVSGQPVALWRLNNNVLSLKENAISKLSLYPNPATNQIYISFEKNLEKANLKIVSMLGQTVYEKSNLSGDNLRLNVSNLTKGTYIIQVSDGISVSNSKFIKN